MLLLRYDIQRWNNQMRKLPLTPKNRLLLSKTGLHTTHYYMDSSAVMLLGLILFASRLLKLLQ